MKGGGRSSARETIGRVAPGAIAKKILKQFSGTEVSFKLVGLISLSFLLVICDHNSLHLFSEFMIMLVLGAVAVWSICFVCLYLQND